MTLDSSVRIGLLLPDVLGTYADGGNATVLAQRLRWRGVHAEVLSCPASEEPPTGCEIYLLGGGEDAAQLFAADWLRERPALCRALAGPAVTLAVCAGLQILGHTLTDAAGQTRSGAGLLDLATHPRAGRATGEITTECLLPGVGRLSGFENHRGVTTLGPDARPLGRVLRGVGNGDRGRWGRGGEGARAGRIFGTYLHGPVLARNPALADHLLTLATGSQLAELDVADQAALRRQYLG